MLRTLVAGLVLEGIGTAAFALLNSHPSPALFAGVMAFDSFAQSYAGVALITYMSSLTSLGYTATQYALLSSTYALLGKLLKGFSGMAVEMLTPFYGLLGAYATAFLATAAMAIPPLLLVVLLWRVQMRSARAGGPGGAG
jgi:PAT family beta-lactamase induction signal transducer AmpG